MSTGVHVGRRFTAACRRRLWARCRSRARPLPSRFSRWWPGSQTNASGLSCTRNSDRYRRSCCGAGVRCWHFTTNSIAWNFRSLLGVQRTWRDVPPSPASQLRDILDRRVTDGVIRRMIDKWLKAGVLEDGLTGANDPERSLRLRRSIDISRPPEREDRLFTAWYRSPHKAALALRGVPCQSTSDGGN
jgi:hypothetical protein